MQLSLFKQKAFYIAFAATLAASLAGRWLAKLPGLKVVGAMVIALLLGMLMQLIPGLREKNMAGIGFISNKFLRLGIILLGFKLNLGTLISSGTKSLVWAVIEVFVMLLLIFTLAKAFKVHDELALLTAGGCSICGAAAVMGISPQVKAKADDSVLAVAIVAILGTVFTLITTILQPLTSLTEVQYGVWCGSSLHEIAHVVAAADAGGATEAAMDAAIIMKLSRVLMLAPAAVVIGFVYQKRLAKNQAADLSGEKAKLPIPWFMAGFIATSVIGTLLSAKLGAENVKDVLVKLEALAYIILGMAMAALGLSVNFKVLLKRGGKILLAAVIGSVILYGVSFAVASLFF